MSNRIGHFRDLNVYKIAFELGITIFEITKGFPKEEKYSLTDQIRRSSRSVCANIAEAWNKRIYPASFIAKLSDAGSECAETLVWLDFAHAHKYLDKNTYDKLDDHCEHINAMLINMLRNNDHWTIPKK